MKIAKNILFVASLLLLVVSCAPIAEPPLASLDSTPRIVGDKYVPKIDNFQVILDASLSMADGSPEDFLVARSIVGRINQAIPTDLKYKGGLRSIGHSSAQSANLTDLLYGMSGYNRNDFHAALGKVHYVGGGTPMADALLAAGNDLKAVGGKSALIIVSDGLHMDNAPAAAQQIKGMLGEDICIYTIAIGNENNGAGLEMLQNLADISQCGEAVTAAEVCKAEELQGFVDDIFLTEAKPKPTPMKMAPKDSDGDGVTDDKDQCPNTPRGDRVDAVGCSLSKDSDGDGVTDDKDQCPNTPRGEMVDEVGCTLKLTLHINFDVDKADIKPEFSGELDKAAAYIKRYSEIPYMLIAGHTDSQGSEAYNQKLSVRRAMAVRDYLINNYDVSEKKLVVRGYGELRPATSNDTAAGRYQNRRVEVICCVILPE
ncbi:OmpA family protein [Malonomonas rubra]|uniref:OmpA family protein n=1 Tax=Malonomonas rubra TaxID=57040 RepID=UPI0026EFB1F5|nr:OmpA family protein [Malonomonas rubra]